MKKVGIAVVLAALLYPALPWLLGRTIEQRVGEYTEQLQQQLPYVSIVQTQFTRGWFSSVQDLTIGGATPLVGVPGTSATIHNVIHHGLICGLTCFGLARIETHFVFPAAAQASVAKIFGNAEPVSIQTRLHLLGGVTTTVTSPPLADVLVDPAGHLSSSGLSFTIDQGAHADRLALHGDLAHLSWRDNGARQLDLDGALLESHSERLLRSLFVGDGAVTLAKLRLEGLPQGAITASELHATTKTRAEGGFVTVTLQFGSGPIVTQPLTLASTEFDFSYAHVNADALESLTAALRAVNQNGATTPADRGEKLAGVLRDKVPAMLLQDPIFRVDRIDLRNAAGALRISGHLGFVGFVAADLGPDADPKALLQKLHASFDLACDQGFLASLPNGAGLTVQLQSYVQQGLVTLEHGQFRSKLEFAAGQLTFNGHAAPTATGPARPAPPLPVPAPPPGRTPI